MKVDVKYDVTLDDGVAFSLTPDRSRKLIAMLVQTMRASTIDIDLGDLEDELVDLDAEQAVDPADVPEAPAEEVPPAEAESFGFGQPSG